MLTNEKKIDPSQIISKTFSLDDIEKAFNFSLFRNIDKIKTLIKFK